LKISLDSNLDAYNRSLSLLVGILDASSGSEACLTHRTKLSRLHSLMP